MASAAPQLNIRSAFARERVASIARSTGMTATQVVEEALRAYTPPTQGDVPEGMIRVGPLLVMASRGRTITVEEADAAIEAVRNERGL